MKANDITTALGDVGHKWTRQIKAEEKRPSARRFRQSLYARSRVSLREICFENMAAGERRGAPADALAPGVLCRASARGETPGL
jgi:hypothetical protein